MAQHVLAKEILNKIINEGMPFSLALKQAFKKSDIAREDRSTVSAVVGCVLRHYLVMSKIVASTYPEMESLGVIGLLIALSNALFVRKMDQEACNQEVKQYIKEGEMSVEDFIAPYLEKKKLVPEDIEVGSFEFLSYRYNTPIEVIKMWNKQFGHISMNKALKLQYV